MLAKTAGVKHLIVLINKMDDPTVEWSQERQVYQLFSNFKIHTIDMRNVKLNLLHS